MAVGEVGGVRGHSDNNITVTHHMQNKTLSAAGLFMILVLIALSYLRITRETLHTKYTVLLVKLYIEFYLSECVTCYCEGLAEITLALGVFCYVGTTAVST